MKRITFRASLLMLALMISLPTWAGTYIENFDDGDFDGWEALDPAAWKVVDGVVTGKFGELRGTVLLFGEDDWRNYTIECDAKIVEPITNLPAASLGIRMLFRNLSDFNYLWCLPSVAWGTALIWPWLNGRELATSAQKPFKQEMNHWYHLKGVADEDNFEFYIDGELMASLSDSRFPTGRVLLQTNGCVAHFDNVVITGDDVPDNTTAVSISGKLATTWGQLRSQ
jgi:hypothetical protein